jgi:hypothetical protein
MKVLYIHFPKKFTFTAINLFGCVFIGKQYEKDLKNRPFRYEKLIRHESIHSAQGKELLWVFFYLFYVLEWLVRLIQYRKAKTPDGKKDRNAAYRNISFEREAYSNEWNNRYLKNRKWWASFGYIRL